MGVLKERLKDAIGPNWRARARALSRLRWIAKYKVLRRSASLRDAPLRNLGYVLWDPEVGAHTYDVANIEELADFICEEFGCDRDRVLGYLREPETDPVFNDEWRRRMRFRFDFKHRLKIANRLLWWGLVRSLRPRMVVECGIYTGIGSLVLLRALERNRQEREPGELLSIDDDPTMGQAVPAGLKDHWEVVTGTTTEVLDESLGGRVVDLLIHDTGHTYENQMHEFSTALAHAATLLVLIDSSGGQSTALQELCEREGGRYRFFRERPRNHFYPGNGTGIGIFERDWAQPRSRADTGSDSTVWVPTGPFGLMPGQMAPAIA